MRVALCTSHASLILAIYSRYTILFVKPVNDEFKSAWQAEKKAAQEAQKRRRGQELDDRRAQTTALMALAMGVIGRMQNSESDMGVSEGSCPE